MNRQTTFPSMRLFTRLATTALVLLGLAACETPTRFASQVISKPSRPLKTLNIVYVEKELRASGTPTTDKRDEKLTDYGYYDLGRLLKERAPVVLAANQLSGNVTVIPQAKPNGSADIAPTPPEGGLLTLQVSGGQAVKANLALHRSYLNFSANLLGETSPGAPRPQLWTSRINFRLGADEAMGVLLIHRIDVKFVDDFIVGMLNSMNADGVIALPQSKAIRP